MGRRKTDGRGRPRRRRGKRGADNPDNFPGKEAVFSKERRPPRRRPAFWEACAGEEHSGPAARHRLLRKNRRRHRLQYKKNGGTASVIRNNWRRRL